MYSNVEDKKIKELIKELIQLHEDQEKMMEVSNEAEILRLYRDVVRKLRKAFGSAEWFNKPYEKPKISKQEAIRVYSCEHCPNCRYFTVNQEDYWNCVALKGKGVDPWGIDEDCPLEDWPESS